MEEMIKQEIKNFNPEKDLKKLPYESSYYFIRQGKRIIWMNKGEKYCAARYYPNEETAEQVMELLREKTERTDIEVWKDINKGEDND